MAGRQKAFDRDEVLEQAMLVFWKKGFLGAALSDLTRSMGINKPSLYATFGNKEQLFIEATEHYLEKFARPHTKFLQQENKTLRERLRAFLLSTVAGQCDAHRPRGCYISLCVNESASESIPDAALGVITQARDYGEQSLRNFFQEEISAGNICSDNDAQKLALFFTTLLHGTAAMARSGKTLAEIEPLIDVAMAALD